MDDLRDPLRFAPHSVRLILIPRVKDGQIIHCLSVIHQMIHVRPHPDHVTPEKCHIQLCFVDLLIGISQNQRKIVEDYVEGNVKKMT